MLKSIKNYQKLVWGKQRLRHTAEERWSVGGELEKEERMKHHGDGIKINFIPSLPDTMNLKKGCPILNVIIAVIIHSVFWIPDIVVVLLFTVKQIWKFALFSPKAHFHSDGLTALKYTN